MLGVYMCVVVVFFFFKQKTAYEMRISDWSSDVCSSDLPAELGGVPGALLCPPVAVHLLGDAQQHEGVEGSGRHGDPLAVQHLDAVAPGLARPAPREADGLADLQRKQAPEIGRAHV